MKPQVLHNSTQVRIIKPCYETNKYGKNSITTSAIPLWDKIRNK